MKSLDAKKGDNKAETAESKPNAFEAAAAGVSAPSVQLDLSKVKIEDVYKRQDTITTVLSTRTIVSGVMPMEHILTMIWMI